MKFRNFAVSTLVVVSLTACASQQTQYVDVNNDKGPVSMSLDYRDFNQAADGAIETMLASPALNKPGGGRYVVAISKVSNRTLQRIDTDRVVKKLRVALLNSGKATITTAVGYGGAEDPLIMQVRELRDSSEFDQRTVVEEHGLLAPDLSLSGKFIQRNVRAGLKQQQVEYAFQLTLTDMQRGYTIWEYEKEIIKRGSNKTVAW